MEKQIKDDLKYTTESGKTRYYSEVRAKNKYESKAYDNVLVRMPKGSVDKIKELTGKAPATFLKELGMAELDKLS